MTLPIRAARAFTPACRPRGRPNGLMRTCHPLRNGETEAIMSLTARPGYLRLIRTAKTSAAHSYAIAGSAPPAVTFLPCRNADGVRACKHFQQAAGLVCYYGQNKFHYLHISHDETLGKHIRVMSALPDARSVTPSPSPIPYSIQPAQPAAGGGGAGKKGCCLACALLKVMVNWRAAFPETFRHTDPVLDEAAMPGTPQLHRRLGVGAGLPEHGGHPDFRGLRLFRLCRTRLSGRSFRADRLSTRGKRDAILRPARRSDRETEQATRQRLLRQRRRIEPLCWRWWHRPWSDRCRQRRVWRTWATGNETVSSSAPSGA